MASNRDQESISGAATPEILVAQIQGWMEEQSRLAAKVQTNLAALADHADALAKLDNHPKAWDLEYKTLGNEVGGRVRLTGTAMTTMMVNAQAVVRDLPNTHAALGKGAIRFEHVKVIEQESRILHNLQHRQPNPPPFADQAEAAEQTRLAAHVTALLAETTSSEMAASVISQEQMGDEALQAAQAQIVADLFARYEAAVLPHAYSKTPNQVRTIAKRIANQLTGATLDQRHQHAVDQRCVFVEPLDDGMAKLSAIVEASLAYGVLDRITRQAKTILTANRRAVRKQLENQEFDTATATDPRTIDQLRADLLTDLLLTGEPHGHLTNGSESIQARVQITIPMLGLLTPEQLAKVRAQNPALQHVAGIDGNPVLAGYGPMDHQTARNLTGQAPGINRILLEPIVGSVLETDRYTPNTDLKRFLTARDGQCRFVGCGIKAARSEIDHTIPYSQGGKTSNTNLQYLCKSHHDLKHHSWTAVLEPDGIFKLTSPQGQQYVQEPLSQTMYQPPPAHPYENPYFGPPAPELAPQIVPPVGPAPPF